MICACNDALSEYEGVETDISIRTIRLDLKAMRSDLLGYNAPIIVTEKKFYSYETDDYSISNSPLTSKDLNILQEVSHLLRQFKGFSHFNEVSEMINKLEDKIYSEQYHQAPVIDFEKNELLTGIEWLDLLYKAIVEKKVLLLTYQSFKARAANDFLFYPYLLKEYRNRWFVLGMKKQGKEIITFALDRIQNFTIAENEIFTINKTFNPQTYFNKIIGVTRNTAETPTRIVFWANSIHAPYIKTKPIHASQKLLEDVKGGAHFSIDVIPNFEMERELIGFGEGIKILSPNNIVRQIKRKIKLMKDLYETEQE